MNYLFTEAGDYLITESEDFILEDVGNYLLQEDSFKILQEDGSYLLLDGVFAYLYDSQNNVVSDNTILTYHAQHVPLTVQSCTNDTYSDKIYFSTILLSCHEGNQLSELDIYYLSDLEQQCGVWSVDDSAHYSYSGSVSLLQHQKLVQNSGSHVTTSGSLALVQHQKISANSLTNYTSSGSILLVQHHTLYPQDSSHNTSSGSLTLTLKQQLASNSSSHSTSSGSVALIQHHALQVGSCNSLTNSTNVSLAQAGNVYPDNSTVQTYSDNVNLTQHYNSSINSANNEISSGVPFDLGLEFSYLGEPFNQFSVTGSSTISSLDYSYQGEPFYVNNIVLQNINLIQHQILTVQSSSHSETSGSIALLQHHSLTVQNSEHTSSSDNIVIASKQQIIVSSPNNLVYSDNIALTQHQKLQVNDSSSYTYSTNISLTQAGTVVADDSSIQTYSDNINLTQHYSLVIGSSNNSVLSDNITLAQLLSILVSDSSHSTTSENISLGQSQLLSINDCSHEIISGEPDDPFVSPIGLLLLFNQYAESPTVHDIVLIHHPKFTLEVQNSTNEIESGMPSSISRMEFSYQGEPFVQIDLGDGTGISSLDYSYQGEPFYGEILPLEELVLIQHQVLSVNNSNHTIISGQLDEPYSSPLGLLLLFNQYAESTTVHDIVLVFHPLISLDIHSSSHFVTSDNIVLTSNYFTLEIDNSNNYVSSDNISLSTKYVVLEINDSINVLSSTKLVFYRAPTPVVPVYKKTCKRVVVNDLQEVVMKAGDQQEFKYLVVDGEGVPVDTVSSDCSIIIFNYSNPDVELFSLSGESTQECSDGEFVAILPSDLTAELFGVYQQQVKVVDKDGITHIPSQGRIVILPKTDVYA